jgi:hypothetical protein
MSMVVRLYAPHGTHTASDAVRKFCQEHGIPRRDWGAVFMIRWLAEAFRYLLMSSTERYLGHAINRCDFERRLRVVRRGYIRFNKSDRLVVTRTY